jgi:tRNA(fMet)-specific endonuclease VapC
MKYLWDTDICVYHLNGNPNIQQTLKAIGAEHICTTGVTIAELKFGAYNSTKIETNLQRIEALQQTIVVLKEFHEQITSRFAQTKSYLKKHGVTIGDFDVLIASFALHHNLILVTNNISHFSPIPDIQMENWTQLGSGNTADQT